MEIKGQYLTYNEYKALGGNLDQTPFNILEYEVRRKIDERTFGRLKRIDQIPQEVKMCSYALINCVKGYNETSNSKKNIASESIDGYSVSYSNTDVIKTKNNELEDIINTYLLGVVVNGEHILYLGI